MQFPERDLAKAVIFRALKDAMPGKPDLSDNPQDKPQALIFLTAETGEWADDRRFWCEVAGIDERSLVNAGKKAALLGGAGTGTRKVQTPYRAAKKRQGVIQKAKK